MNTLVIIPARRESTRLPGKNHRVIAGKPCIQYVIEDARAAKCQPDVVILSDHEDDHNIHSIARKMSVPIWVEPKTLRDSRDLYKKLAWTVRGIEKKETSIYDLVIQQYANSPLRPVPNVIDRYVQFLEHIDADAVSAFVQIPHSWHPWNVYRRLDDNRITHHSEVWRTFGYIGSEDFPPLFADASLGGAFRRRVIEARAHDRRIMVEQDNRMIQVDWPCFDLNTMDDVELAEFYLQRRQEKCHQVTSALPATNSSG